jgi:hypothetical protein
VSLKIVSVMKLLKKKINVLRRKKKVGLVKHPLKGDEAAGLHIVGAELSEAPTEGQRSQ